MQLRFDARAITAESQWNANPALRTVGSLNVVDPTGGVIDVIGGGLFRSGSIAGLVELRDGTSTACSSSLMSWRRRCRARSPTRRARARPPRLAPQAASTLICGPTGRQCHHAQLHAHPLRRAAECHLRRVEAAGTLPLPANAAGDANNPVVGINFAGGMASVVTQIQTALGAGFAVSNPAGTTRCALSMTARRRRRM